MLYKTNTETLYLTTLRRSYLKYCKLKRQEDTKVTFSRLICACVLYKGVTLLSTRTTSFTALCSYFKPTDGEKNCRVHFINRRPVKNAEKTCVITTLVLKTEKCYRNTAFSRLKCQLHKKASMQHVCKEFQVHLSSTKRANIEEDCRVLSSNRDCVISVCTAKAGCKQTVPTKEKRL